MAASMDTGENNVGQYQVRFVTKLDKYFLPDSPFSVPSNVTASKLNLLINRLLSESTSTHNEVGFDFLINTKLLREELGQHICQNNISEEEVVEVEYIEKYNTPQPENSLNHDDWVGAVHANDNWIITGCYDNTIHVWNLEGKHKLTIPGHNGPIKGISWIASDAKEKIKMFVSVSQDQTAMLWKWDSKKNSVECVNTCRGHARTVDCVATHPQGRKFVTGSWDKMLKIWSVDDDENSENEHQDNKRQKTESGVGRTKTPIMTLSGHLEPVSSVRWMNDNEVCSSSWDHTIKIWDIELGGMKTQLPGSKAFFDISYSNLCGQILSASADRHIRLWDQRIKGGNVMKCNYTSHTGWISAVHWSPVSENHFISGSHDNLLKLWDKRLTNSPLYDMSGHEEKVMCVDWSLPNYVMSGAVDNTLKIYKTDSYVT